MLCLVGNFIIC